MARKSEKNQYFTFERDGKTLEQSELANVLNSFTHQLINYIPALDITTLPVFFPADEPAPIVELHEIANVYPDKPFHVSRTRKKELYNIELLFSTMTDDEDVVRTVYLTGQPGSGKTELARQYGDQFKNATSASDTSKHLVITLNANSEEFFMKSAKEAVRKLQLSVCMELTKKSLKELMKNLRDYFRGYSSAWLLIIDDMFEKNHFNYLFPRPGGKEWGGGHVLVTTQDNNLVPAGHLFAKKLSLNEGMTKEDAVALLKEISDVEVDAFAEEIIDELQSLPLALAWCATYVGETRQDRPSIQFGWKEYLDLYRENAHLQSQTFSNHNVYPLSMTAATTMAVKRMAETSDVLRLTFSFLSYCELLPVPLNVLAHHVLENLSVQNDKQPTTKEEIKNEISRCTLLVHGRSQNVETIKYHQVIHSAFQSVENTKPVEQRELEFVKMMKSLNETLDFMDNTYKEDVLLKVLVKPHLKSFVDQFAYKRGQNCTMALIKCYHNWLEWLDGDADFVRVFTFDFKKAFDYVSHYILSEKLKALKVNPYIINWIIDFLSDRRQRVTVDGITTEYVNINRGVPQGSVLGPVLFSIMVTDDIGTIYEEKSLMTKFADDLTLSVPVKANGFDPSSDEIANIQKWSFENSMSLNLEKTWEMVVRGKTNKSLPLPISGIERKNEFKLFGVTLNENPCNWDTHIDSLLQKAGSRMYILRVCKFYGFPMKDLEMLFNSLIVSLFFYAIEVWGGAFQKLERDEDALNFLCKAYSMTEGKSEKEWLLLRCRISFNLARTYCKADSIDLAIEMMKTSIELAKKVYVNEEDKIMNRFVCLAGFYLSWDRFWKLAEVVGEATEFLNSCSADCVSVNRARSLNYLAIVYSYNCVFFSD
ncbi:RNA-directed DNA polymerase from transposon BS [Paramuricea clavata]|uniref:RNA-directed DNA polymerase from transposon BS n=1 Tax=Paramuricea clavata TaxID=317549 RepID=A0A6S7GCN3_PARCT|nr:RNA-directed DNA polymerase from transposon BS [Paramuricea clavata]